MKHLIFICLSLIATGQAFSQNPVNTSKLRITTTPTEADTLSQVLVRDPAASGEVKYRPASTFTPTTVTDGDKGDISVSSGSWSIDNSAVTFSKLQNSAAGLSVIGRSTNSSGVFGEITAATSGHVLRLSGTTLGFGTLASGAFASNTIPISAFANITGLSVLGRSASTSGAVAAITGTDGNVLRVSGTTLGFGTIAAAGITDGAVTNAKLQNSSISFSTGTSGTDVSWSSSPVSLGGTITLNIPDASATARGLISTGNQTIAGGKIFSTSPAITSIPGSSNTSILVAGTGGQISSKSETLLKPNNLLDGDKGDVSISGGTWNIDNGAVTNSKLQNSSISFSTGTSGTDVNWSSSPVSLGGTATLNIPDASTTARGLITTGTQNLAGTKTFSSNVGIGTTTPHAPLQFSQTTANRKIVLRESADNDHEFYGFGTDTDGALRYQIPATGAEHRWYTGASSSSSTLLMELTGTGFLRLPVTPTNDNTEPSILVRQSDGEIQTRAASTLGVTDGDKGDITVSSSGAAWAIDSDVLTTVSTTAPAESCITNCDAVLLQEFQYVRIKDRVIFSGQINIDATSAGSAVIVEIVPPILSDLTASICTGIITSAGNGYGVIGTNISDNIRITLIPSVSTSINYWFQGMYKIQ